jgi:ATP-binding cassette subfamily G (WHITE) protein 2
MGTLSVRENLMFSANLRLPKSVSKEEKERRVDEVIKELGLTHCADSKVNSQCYVYLNIYTVKSQDHSNKIS